MSRYVFIVWIVILAAVATAAQAQESKILTIQPVPVIGSQSMVMPQEAGYLGGMTEDKIGLEDSDYKFAPDVKFYSENGQLISKSDFKAGEWVGYAINKDNEVVSLWKLNKSPFSK